MSCSPAPHTRLVLYEPCTPAQMSWDLPSASCTLKFTYQEQLQQQHQHKQQGLRLGGPEGAASWLDINGGLSASSGPVC